MQRVEIRVEGSLDPQWVEWFEGMEITQAAGGETRITGDIPDQAAFYGLIAKLRDLGVRLLAVTLKELEVQAEVCHAKR